jgi:ribose 5-phosphate isomerase B
MKVFIGSDHAGYDLKEKLLQFLIDLGYEVGDKGAFSFVPEDDYPDYIAEVAKEIAGNPENTKGIIIGGSGQGEAMVANRFKGVRAGVYYGGEVAVVRLSREHNNANILSIGARFVTEDEAKLAIKIWLETDFSGEPRHERRIKKIDQHGS